jgi:hypothetical protein
LSLTLSFLGGAGTVTGSNADAERVALDMAGVEALDTIGAWLLERLIRRSNRDGKRTQLFTTKEERGN